MSMNMRAAKAGGSAYRRQAMGDPGIFGAIGGALKKVGGFALGSGLVPGGNVIKSVGSALGIGSSSSPALPTLGGGGVSKLVGPNGTGGGGGGGNRLRFGGGGAVGTLATGQLYRDTSRVKSCPPGHHPNKSAYYRRDAAGNVLFIPKGHVCVKNRRRNPLNPDALRRAVARIDAGKVWQGTMREIETKKYTKAGNKKDGCR